LLLKQQKKSTQQRKKTFADKATEKKYQANVCRHLLTKQIFADEADIALVRATILSKTTATDRYRVA